MNNSSFSSEDEEIYQPLNNSKTRVIRKIGRISDSLDLTSLGLKDNTRAPKAPEQEEPTDTYNKLVNSHEISAIASDLVDNETRDQSALSRRRFVKVGKRGEVDSPQEKTVDNDISYFYWNDKSKFIGEFKADEYKITRSYLNSSKYLRLHYTKLEHNERRIASLAIIHGYAEHSARFMEMADHFVREGFVVHLIDLRGFGFSGGTHGVATIKELHDDIKLLLQQVDKNLPLFLYGHSIGASLLSSFLMRNKWIHIAGVVLTSAVFGFARETKINWFKKNLIRAFGGHFEEVVISGRLNNTHITKNNYQIKQIVQDQVSSPYVTLRMAKNAIELIDYIIPNAHKFRYPVLVIHGLEDKITKCRDSVRFYNKISSADKTLKLFDEGFHELHNDVEKMKLKDIITRWMRERLKSKQLKKFAILDTIKTGIKRKTLKLWHKVVLFLLVLLYFSLLW